MEQRPWHNGETEAEKVSDEFHEFSGIRLIGKDDFDLLEMRGDKAEKIFGYAPVLRRRLTYDYGEEKAEGIDNDMALPPLYVFPCVISGKSNVCNGFYRLAVYDARCRTGSFPAQPTYLLAEFAVHPFEDAGCIPCPKIFVHGFPFRKVMRKKPPGASGSCDVENGVEYFSPRVFRRTAACGSIALKRGNVWLDDFPLFIGEIRIIRISYRTRFVKYHMGVWLSSYTHMIPCESGFPDMLLLIFHITSHILHSLNTTLTRGAALYILTPSKDIE